ncbi:hypothetical protein C9374_001065 [Naegleria lovaniensis]|uniref:Zn(2)-C6 fungal-type domain-containing protein n=1 Tax=Naegleria lovaniensis TaxID=51637 RepID=A0AA88GWE5_NAELO|nr:uncharacterized protein C9374_001065 [Naegleria lovaniensis]KAG2388215.1 hypothetical protein C9374_001065 [Naegleria lovaniensis]
MTPKKTQPKSSSSTMPLKEAFSSFILKSSENSNHHRSSMNNGRSPEEIQRRALALSSLLREEEENEEEHTHGSSSNHHDDNQVDNLMDENIIRNLLDNLMEDEDDDDEVLNDDFFVEESSDSADEGLSPSTEEKQSRSNSYQALGDADDEDADWNGESTDEEEDWQAFQEICCHSDDEGEEDMHERPTLKSTQHNSNFNNHGYNATTSSSTGLRHLETNKSIGPSPKPTSLALKAVRLKHKLSMLKQRRNGRNNSTTHRHYPQQDHSSPIHNFNNFENNYSSTSKSTELNGHSTTMEKPKTEHKTILPPENTFKNFEITSNNHSKSSHQKSSELEALPSSISSKHQLSKQSTKTISSSSTNDDTKKKSEQKETENSSQFEFEDHHEKSSHSSEKSTNSKKNRMSDNTLSKTDVTQISQSTVSSQISSSSSQDNTDFSPKLAHHYESKDDKNNASKTDRAAKTDKSSKKPKKPKKSSTSDKDENEASDEEKAYYACLECKESHRKCSRTLPACSRCIKRGFKCEYPEPPISPKRKTSAITPKDKKEKKRKSEEKNEVSSPTTKKKSSSSDTEPSPKKKKTSKKSSKEKSSSTDTSRANDSDDDVIFVKEEISKPAKQKTIESFFKKTK